VSAHPYIPNSAPLVREEMLRAIGVGHVDELYSAVPPELKLQRPLNLPEPFNSELGLKRHVQGLLSKNWNCSDTLNFLGGGCWQHYVPAVCDEINARAEFLTAYGGDTYSDLGKYQAIFEFQSMVGELVGMEVVSTPTYDWAAAATSALLMACRITGRRQVVVARTTSAERLAHLRNFAQAAAEVRLVDYDRATGFMDLDDLRRKVTPEVGAVYFENPSYLGFLEANSPEISALAHEHGALSVVGVDACSLGVLSAPSDYGADIVCGDAQALGNHMHYGGGLCGFIASRDAPEYVAEYPSILVSMVPGTHEGEWGFGWSTMERTSFDKRESARDFTGTTQWLWGITAAVYLSLMGPDGMRELGETLMQKAAHAMELLDRIPGVRAPVLASAQFKEFVVNFDGTHKTVAEINRGLRERGIFGGKDLSTEFPELGQSALYCVTEIHTRNDLERLADMLEEII
jgi:glycine cleavage system P protein (glycine dehydrogenase) subunit 1